MKKCEQCGGAYASGYARCPECVTAPVDAVQEARRKLLAEATPEMLEKWAQVAEVDAAKYLDPHTPDALNGLAHLARAIAKCARHRANIEQEATEDEDGEDYWYISLTAPHGTGDGKTLMQALAAYHAARTGRTDAEA